MSLRYAGWRLASTKRGDEVIQEFCNSVRFGITVRGNRSSLRHMRKCLFVGKFLNFGDEIKESGTEFLGVVGGI